MAAGPLPANLILTDERVRAVYAEAAGIYRIIPHGVALPASLVDLRELTRWATTSGIGLIPRGAGSGIPGGAVGPGVVVDLRERLPRVLSVDPQAGTALTSAAVTHRELSQAAAMHGFRLPPDPASSAWATLGGMVATNASGPHTVRYGPVRAWVEALEVVTADGESGWLTRGKPGSLLALDRFRANGAPAIRAASAAIRTRFPATRKNTAGYALDAWLSSGDDLDLWIGSEGTLGFLTTVRWRLDPIPAARAGVRISLGSLDDLEPAVRALTAFRPSAVELLDRTFLDLIAFAHPAHASASPMAGLPPATEAVLLVEFEGTTPQATREAVGDAVRSLQGIALQVLTAVTAEEEKHFWALRHAASPILASLPPDRRSLQVIEDGCVPLARLGDYIRAIRQAGQRWNFMVVIFGHAGDGNLHVNVLPEMAQSDWPERIAGLFEEVTQSVLQLGGTPSGEHGDGRLRTPILERVYGAEILALFRQVKTDFDPHGIFNPGVKLGAAAGGLPNHLKLGPGAASLPEDIAQALREIERTGGYARSRLDIALQRGSGARGQGSRT